ncbi:hypothetical protein KSP39_PZI006684 [Platanthera zijinensis]|uniref:Chlorophyll synthase n=1 Tax=Platanthera zijinensis TaxID=2320716 RepID=A0AAP0GAC4_9ASPA
MGSILHIAASISLSMRSHHCRRLPALGSPSAPSLSRRRCMVKAVESDSNEAKTAAPNKPSEAINGSSFNQLLGIKGAALENNKWKIRLQLTKPVTWPPLVWGVVCGAAASGNFHWSPDDVAKSIVCMIMSGPCLTGYTQTLNDWYDRDIDAINEPYRPIPSGAISENEVITQIWLLLLGGIGLAGLLDVWGMSLQLSSILLWEDPWFHTYILLRH